jgi:hypothetical protein
MATDIGTGTTITFGTSGFSADLLSISHGGMAREAIQTSHMGTTSDHTFMPTDLVDNGEVTVEIAFVATLTPPILTNAAAETITIAYAGSGTTWSFSAFQTGFEITAPLEDKMTATLTLKVTGGVTVA